MPPPYSKDGYSQVPQAPAPAPAPTHQPAAWGQTPGYAPAPPVLQQQNSNTVCHDS